MTRSREPQVVSKVTSICLVVILMSSSVAFCEPLEMPMGTADVDGDLGEWAEANWISLDEVYHGDPKADLSNAKWAAMWSFDTIYVAVTGTDSDHEFNDSYENWDRQDAVEIYVDAANKDTGSYDNNHMHAQQYIGGPRDTQADEEWLNLAGNPAPDWLVPAFKADVSGDVISYEMAITPYDTLDKSNPENSTVLMLAPGMTLGLDVVMSTKHADGFGMLCQNMDERKWGDAGQFLDHVTVPEPSSIALLLTSGIGLMLWLSRARQSKKQ